MKLSDKEKEGLWGKYDGHCAYCGRVLDAKTWQIDHLVPVLRYPHSSKMRHPEHDTIANMMPSCPACNSDKNNYSTEEWKELLERRLAVLKNWAQKHPMAYRKLKNFGILQEIPEKIEFFFEKQDNLQ